MALTLGYPCVVERNAYDESLELRGLVKTVELLQILVSMSETPIDGYTETAQDEYRELVAWLEEARTFSTGDYSDEDIRAAIQKGEGLLMVLDDYCQFIVQEAKRLHPRLKRWLAG